MSQQAEPGTLRRAQRIDAIEISPILRLGAQAEAARAAGRPVISLGAGEPDFATPDHVLEAAARAMRDGQTKYTALDGSPAIKEAVRAKFAHENGLAFAADEITVSAGAKQILFNALMATLDPGDEVILPAPYWTSYGDIVAICGGRAVTVACPETAGFRLTAEALERAIGPRTRWLLLNAPSNPSGAAYSAAELSALAGVLERHPQVWVLSDDIYEHILYDGRAFATIAAVAPALAARTLTINGVSKSYAMTGWRIGFAGGPKALIQAMAVVQSQSTSCPSSVSQAAAVAALLGPQELLAERRASFQRRRDLVVRSLNETPGLSCRVPEGAFYVFPSCAGWIGRRAPDGRLLSDDLAVSDWLLDRHDVAVVPGSAFGLPGYFRISYAAAEARLREACGRLQAAGASLDG